MNKKVSHETWMLKAIKQAEKAYSHDEVPIGCVIVKNDFVIGQGYNQVENLNDATAHCEMIAITSATNYLGDWRLNDCSIYITKEPCIMCFGAITNSRIKNLYYGMQDLTKGYNVKIKDQYLLNTHLENTKFGILEDQCRFLVEDFFINKRKKNKKTYK